MARIDVHVEDEAETRVDNTPIHIEERMNVVGSDHRLLGNIVYILVNEDVEGEDLLVVNSRIDGRDVLLPAMAIEEESDGNLVVAITEDDIKELPDYVEDRDPSREDLERAYGTLGVEVEFDE